MRVSQVERADSREETAFLMGDEVVLVSPRAQVRRPGMPRRFLLDTMPGIKTGTRAGSLPFLDIPEAAAICRPSQTGRGPLIQGEVH